MNINSLEKSVRETINGDNPVDRAREMLEMGKITPAEYRSLCAVSTRTAATGSREEANVVGGPPQTTWF